MIVVPVGKRWAVWDGLHGCSPAAGGTLLVVKR